MSDTEKFISDKETESDGQMMLRISRKFMLFLVVFLLFDSLLELVSSLIDILLGLLHLIIDLFEYSFELLLEHLVNANHQESEVIIVNLAIIISIYGVYRLFLLLPRLSKALISRMKSTYSRQQQKKAEYWRHLSINRQIKTFLTYLVWVSVVLLVVTL